MGGHCSKKTETEANKLQQAQTGPIFIMRLVSALQSASDQLMKSTHISVHFSDFFCLTLADIFPPLRSNRSEVSDLQFEQFSESLHRPFVPTQERNQRMKFPVSY